MLRKAGSIVLLAVAGCLLLAILIFVAPAGAAQEVATSNSGRIGIHGQVTALSDDSFILESARGTLTVAVDERTTFRIIGLDNPTLADLAVGDQLLVRGQRQEDGLLAAFVARVPVGERMGGRVETVSELEISLTGRDGQIVTIRVNSSTWLAVGGEDYTWAGDPPGREVLEPGMRLVAFGTLADAGQALTADTLVVLPRPRPRIIAGEVTGITAEAFSFHTRQGRDITVLVDENTRFRLSGVSDPGLDDLAIGDCLAVFGRPVAEGQFLAKGVAGRPDGLANRPAR